MQWISCSSLPLISQLFVGTDLFGNLSIGEWKSGSLCFELWSTVRRADEASTANLAFTERFSLEDYYIECMYHLSIRDDLRPKF